MNRHLRRRKKIDKEYLYSAVMIVLVVCVFVFIPPIFRAIDCRNAKAQVEFTALCEAHDNCSLSSAELKRHKNYIRLMLRSCPITEETK